MASPLDPVTVRPRERGRTSDTIRVLLVDDDETFAASARALLERRDQALEVLTAFDARSALRCVGERRVDCVVADYSMPSMDGIELAKRIARTHPGIPFILLTGRGGEEIAMRAIRADVDDYVSKDADPDPFAVLVERIRSCLDRRPGGSVTREAWMNASVGLAVHDPDTGAFLDVNHHYCEMLGYTREQMLDASLEEIAAAVGSATPERARELVRSAAHEGPAWAEWLGEASDGSPLWIEITLQATEIGGQQRILASVQDVTTRREREEALRRMYETIADPRLSFEEQVDRLMTLGRSVLGTGFATLSRVAGEDYVFDHVQSPGGEVEPGDVVSIHETLCEEAVVTEERLVVDDPLDAQNRTRGKALQLSCYVGAPVYLDDEVHGTFCFYDVEPRDRSFSDWEITLVDLMSRWISSAKERIRIHDELERENERLEDFASMVSHDLRSPLAIATGHLGLLRNEFDHASIGEALDALERISEIVEDALTWARTGSAVGQTEPVSVADSAQAAWSHVEHADARMTVETGGTIRAEATRLKQLFENLFRNAVEHGGADVHVTVGGLDRGFFVEDDGPGLPADAGSKLFEAGYSTADAGTGFGLAIVQQIADAHGWTLEASQGDTGGARIEVRGVEPALGQPSQDSREGP